MSIDPISANRQQQFQQIRDNFQALSQALSGGNLAAAQKAFAAIQQDQKNGPQPPANSPLANDFDSLGQALQSGDLDAAQQAFASVQSDFQSMKRSGHGGRSHGGGNPSGDSDSPSDPSGLLSAADAQKTVASEVTTTNADGSITITTTYSDGSTSTSTEPNPNPPVSKNPLDSANSGQMAVLLNAQEEAAA